MRFAVLASIAVVLLAASPALTNAQRDSLPLKSPAEALPGVETIYGSVLVGTNRVRTIVTRPTGTTGRLPGLFLVPWLSCDTSAVPAAGGGGSDHLLRGLITRSGFAMMRVDRPGLGDSEGPPCEKNDFNMDLASYRAALRSFARSEYVDPDRIYLVGWSNGGGVAPIVAGGEDPVRVAGYIVSGAWARTWLEHMIDLERVRLPLSGASPAETTAKIRAFQSFYDLYYNAKLTPGDIAQKRPDLAGLWYDAADGQYGRPAAFYQQLQALDLGAAWADVDVPVLAVYGDADWIMCRADHQLIVDRVNRRKAGVAKLVVVPGMDHFFQSVGSTESGFGARGPQPFATQALDVMLEWLRARKGS